MQLSAFPEGMFERLLDAAAPMHGQRGDRAWIGDTPPQPDFTAIDLYGRPGFRGAPQENGRFESAWLVQEAVQQQGWRILVDSALRLLGEHGVLVVRYVQNAYITIPNLKNFLYRKYGIVSGVLAEHIGAGEFLTVFRIRRLPETLASDKKWTFGVLTQGKKVQLVARFCRSVRDHGGPAHQIIIIGPSDPAYEAYEPTYLDTTYSDTLADICVKKNDIVTHARHENVCVLHDRYWLNPDFFQGFDAFGYDFDFLTVRQQHESGKNYPSYCAIDDRCHLIWGQIYECGNENETWTRHYLNGGLLIGKRALLRAVPFNPLIFHNQAEDVEIAKEMAQRSVVPRINRLSSAITDVPDHLTDAFVLAPRTDYDEALRRPLAPAPETAAASAVPQPAEAPPSDPCPASDVNPRPWGPIQGVVERIERRRRAGASWKGVAYLGARFIAHRMAGRSRAVAPAADAEPPAARRRLAARPPEQDGMNMLLYAGESGGVLNVAVHYMRALQRRGIPLCIIDIQFERAPTMLPEDLRPLLRPEPLYPTNVWCIGFPYLEHHLNSFPAWAEGRWNSVFTHWELPRVPARLARNFEPVDSVIVDSEFVRDAIAAVTDRPIELIDPQVRVPRGLPERFPRKHFGLPEDKVLFLLNWEFTSSTFRKNPQAALDAFDRIAVGRRNDVRLVVHVKYEDRYGDAKRREYESYRRSLALDHPNVIVLDQPSFSYDEALGLKAACDCFVSLHRSEGYGMGCAEALALGRRCVMTGWSGNLDLVKDIQWRERIYLVAAKLVPVAPGDFPWVEANDDVQQVWAEVDPDAAVRQMLRALRDIMASRAAT